jgi:hypothetical protein
VAAKRDPGVKMLRHAKAPKGFCVDCAVTKWLIHTYPANMIIDEAELGPAMLLLEVFRAPFSGLLDNFRPDARLDEIHWVNVVANWDLPWPKGSGQKTSNLNPCLSTDPKTPRRGQPGFFTGAAPACAEASAGRPVPQGPLTREELFRTNPELAKKVNAFFANLRRKQREGES